MAGAFGCRVSLQGSNGEGPHYRGLLVPPTGWTGGRLQFSPSQVDDNSNPRENGQKAFYTTLLGLLTECQGGQVANYSDVN